MADSGHGGTEGRAPPDRNPTAMRTSGRLAVRPCGRASSYSLLILLYGLRIRCRADPKSTSAAIPSSIPITRPRPYMSCVTWSPTAKCLGGGATGALKGLVGR